MTPSPATAAAGRLFCFGLGYTALALAMRLRPRGWTIAGTCRSEAQQAQLAAAGIAALGFGNFAGQSGLVVALVAAIGFVLIGLAVIFAVVLVSEAERSIPIHYARATRGGSSMAPTYLPIRLLQAGVMPIIFASSLLIFPSFILKGLERATASWRTDNWTIASAFATFIQEAADSFQKQSYIYTIFYIVLIYFFCYFWTAITFNPKDMAENLKDYGSFIPGYRPGRRTADYLEKVMLRITYVGAAFLSLVAVIPSIVQNALNVDYTIASFLGGTGLLIVISVCLDFVQKIDSHLIMRNYGGLVSKR